MVKKSVAVLAAGFLFLGCSNSISNLGKSSKFQEAKNASTKTEYQALFNKYKEENKTDDLLWDYEAGTVSYYVESYKDSVYYFDEAEKLIKKYDEEVLGSKILANAGATLTNDTFMDYRPRIYEKIMVNAYKGIDFIDLSDMQNARVEFNRALVRQQRAKEFFAKEIQKEKEKLKKESQKKLKNKKGLDISSAASNKKTLEPIEKKYTNLFAFKPYPDFVNPFVTYLSGVFFLNQGDYAKATDLFKETYGMIKGLDEGDVYVLDDFKMADKMKGSVAARRQNYTWVVFFNGEGPIKKELRIDIPLFLFSNNVYYTGIALPTLKMRKRAYAYLSVSNGKEQAQTKRVASMDRIIKTEFKKRFPVIVTRAITRTVVQTVIQKQLKDKAGVMGGVLGALYQGAMNRADTRIWQRLPKEFDVAKVQTSDKLVITTPDGQKIYELKTDPKSSYIVFVTIPKKTSEPIISYQRF